jgi:mannose-6-phosphate isomerase-like protein (cupin superfamily)
MAVDNAARGGWLRPGPQLSEPQVFKYERPDVDDPLRLVRMAKSDTAATLVQVINEGGETHLHSHAAIDGFYFVLGGRAQFYGEGDVMLADLGQFEGIVIPRGCKYWFKSASEQPLELLQVSAFASGTAAAPAQQPS